MKYTKIRLQSVGGTSVDFPFIGLEPDYKYILKAADGLGPPEFEVPVANTVFGGGVLQGRRALAREPVIRIGLNPDWEINQTAADLRSELYGLLEPIVGNTIRLVLMDGVEEIVQSNCLIKNFEISTFVKDPEVQLTLACIEPYLEGPEELDLMPFDGTSFAIDNIGSARTGISLEMKFGTINADPIKTWKITNTSTQETMEFATSFANFDGIRFNTQPGKRDVDMWDASLSGTDKWIDKLGMLTPASKWISLRPGINIFNVVGPADWDWIAGSYRPLYWGV